MIQTWLHEGDKQMNQSADVLKEVDFTITLRLLTPKILFKYQG